MSTYRKRRKTFTEKPIEKLARCFEQLERDPRQHPAVKPLKGNLAGHFRYRVGDYRVIYRFDEQSQSVSSFSKLRIDVMYTNESGCKFKRGER